jgi:Flp pilus assembly protein TadD
MAVGSSIATANRNTNTNPRSGVFLKAACLLLLISVCSYLWAEQDAAAAHSDKGLQLAQSGDLQGAESELRNAVALAPKNPEFLTNLATVLAMEKKLEDSSVFFQCALKLDPSNLIARRYLSANLWQLHRYPEAKQNLELILKQKPNDDPSRLLLGMVAENMNDYSTAARMLSSVPAEVRKQPESIAALAVSYYHLGEKEKARGTLEQLRYRPEGNRAILLGAQIADEAADYETAEQMLNSIASTYSDHADLDYRLAAIEYHAGKFNQSEQRLLHLVASQAANGRVFNLLGWCYEKQGRTEDAQRAFENGVGAQPNDESNYLDLQKVLLAGNRIAAALEIAKKTTDALRDSARAFAMRGAIEMQASQFSNAVTSYRRARQLGAADAESALGLADAEFSADMIKESHADFEAGLAQFPKDARFPLHYSLVLLKEAETEDPAAESRAEEMLRRSLKLDPASVDAHCQLGDLDLRHGRVPDALQNYHTAAKLDPQSAKAHLGLSKVYRRLGRSEEASRETKLFQQLQDANAKSSANSPASQSSAN